MIRNVAIYARVSTEHEAQLSALDNQVQYYDDMLKHHPDWKLYDRYIDEGITGTSIKKRKNFMRMLQDAENGCFDLIVTREVSRFARNTVDTLQETRKLKKIGVEVFFTEDNIWTFNDEDGELKLTIMATLAQNESKKISQRVKAGQKITFLNGVFYGTGNILGYDKVGKDMVVNEEQANVVRLIYSLYLSGKGTGEIKNELEQRGYPTATGLKKWNASCIARILQNPFYCGTVVYRKSYIPDFLEQKAKLNHGEVDKVIVEGRQTPLVSKSDFEKVQKIISKHCVNTANGRKMPCGSPKSVWSKKLICECGSTFNKRIYHKRPDGTSTYLYQCYNQKNNGSVRNRIKKGLDVTDSCNVPIVQEWKLDLMSQCIFRMIWDEKDRIIEIANQLLDESVKEKSSNYQLDSKIALYNKDRENLNNKSKKLLDMYLNELINKDEYIIKKKEITEDLNDVELKLKELKADEIIPTETIEEKVIELKRLVKDKFNFEETKVTDELIASFIQYIKVKKDGFEWKLNLFDSIIDLDIVGREKSASVNFNDNINKLTTELHSGTGYCKK